MDSKPIDAAREFQIAINSASNINPPLYLIASHQKSQRPDPANPANNLSNNRFNNAFFDYAKVRKYYSEINGDRCPRNPIMINYDDNNYLDQYKILKTFYKAYVGEYFLYPIITCAKTKDYCPIQIIDLRFQMNHISPKKNRFFEEKDDNPVNTNLYIILIKHRELNMVSNVNKVIIVEVI